MSGNVWEWCLNKYAKPEIITIDNSNDERVLRGGSWNYGQILVRSANRGYSRPGRLYYIYGFVGFRVVVRRPPSQ